MERDENDRYAWLGGYLTLLTTFITHRLNLAKSIRTDFAPLDSYQKAVRFSSDGHQMLTAGNDGHVRLWHFPWLNGTADINASEASESGKETKVEDVDYDKSSDLIAIVTPSSVMIRCKREGIIKATIPAASGFVFRCARFIKDKKSYLVTVENSKGGDKPILSIWKTDSWTRYSSVKLYTRLRVTTLGASSNGRLIAIGAADGTVAVYDSRLYVSALVVSSEHLFHSFISLILSYTITGENCTNSS